MNDSLKIEDIISKVDVNKTKNFFLTQNLIQNDCDCDDCKFYQEEFTKLSLDINKKLISCGVDLQKNINDEPSGVWVIREENRLIHCLSTYRLYGNFKDIKEGIIEVIESDYKITIQLHKNNEYFVTLYLTIDYIQI